MTIRRRTFLLGGAAVVGGAAVLTERWMASGSDIEPRLFGLSIAGSSPESVRGALDAGGALGRPPQVLNLYMAWQWRDPFPAATVAAIRSTGAIAEISWEPWDPHNGPVQPQYALDALPAFDDYVDTFAKACANDGGDLILRFAHEMNSDWYPWSVSTNGGSPQAYVDAYRRLRSRFQALGATNVRWMWCPNIVYRGRPDLISASYPGDDVVDIVGLDGYNRGGRSPQDLFGPSIDLVTALAPSKPLWIDEVGCIPTSGQAQWVTDFFDYVRQTPVSAVVWFELANPGAPDWRLLSNPDTAEAAHAALAGW